jgi:hypothetical protein
MEEFKILTFKEISDAFNSGKRVDVYGCSRNPFMLKNGFLVDLYEDPNSVNSSIKLAMAGKLKARIVEPKLTRWIVVYKDNFDSYNTKFFEYKKYAKGEEEYRKGKGTWIRTVKVEV